jgi:putative flippase GtrA
MGQVMLNKLFLQRTDHPAIQFLRYGFVAVMAFIVDFGLLYVFTYYCHIFYVVSATLSFSISLVLNYLLSVAWVFPRSSHKRHVEMLFFAIIGFIGLGLNALIIWFCTEKIGVYYLYSKLIAVAIVFFWSFTARRFLLFRDQQAATEE